MVTINNGESDINAMVMLFLGVMVLLVLILLLVIVLLVKMIVITIKFITGVKP